MAPGLTRTYTLNLLPSISTGSTMLGSAGGLKEECTRVSSRSNIKLFLPLLRGLYGFKTPLCMASLILMNGGFWFCGDGGLTAPAAGT